MLSGQRTMSVLKKKGGGNRGQLARMHLGVYPTELKFSSNVDFRTAYYFQKNFQLLGQLHEIIPASPKNTILPLNNINNIVNFRLCDPTNVIYKWSVYRRNDQDEEEHIDSVTFNIKEAVKDYVLPIKSTVNNSTSSILMGEIHRTMGLNFPKINVTITFLLIVSQSQEIIREYVQRKVINKEDDYILQNTFTKTDSSMNGIGLSSRRNASGIGRKSSDPLGELTFSNNKPSQHQATSKQLTSQTKKDDVMKKSTSQNLQNLIFSFDASGTLADAVNVRLENLRIQSKEEEKKEQDPELEFHEEKKQPSHVQTPKNQFEDFLGVENSNKKDDKSGEIRDYSMLKLDSDQGRLRVDPLDKKLQDLQLEAIEEQKPSRECTISMFPLDHVSPLKNRANRLRGQKGPSLEEIKELETELKPQQSTMKKMAIIFIFSLLLFVAAAVMLDGKKKKNRKGKSKR